VRPGELFHPDPAEQVILADRLQEGRVVGGDVPADHPDYLVVAVASGDEPALAPDQLRHRPSPSLSEQRMAKMLA